MLFACDIYGFEFHLSLNKKELLTPVEGRFCLILRIKGGLEVSQTRHTYLGANSAPESSVKNILTPGVSPSKALCWHTTRKLKGNYAPLHFN